MCTRKRGENISKTIFGVDIKESKTLFELFDVSPSLRMRRIKKKKKQCRRVSKDDWQLFLTKKYSKPAK